MDTKKAIDTTTSQSKPKPFSMIREFHLADWFTLGNAVCGMGALFSTMSYLETLEEMHILFACALVLAALVFDILDGRIARWRQKSSALGRELDSLLRQPSLLMAVACKVCMTALFWCFS
jgi:CDP-diacylglycerol---serine O-phosphatidyltransferase